MGSRSVSGLARARAFAVGVVVCAAFGLAAGWTGWGGWAGLGGAAQAQTPTNPILFVTQVPMPEEVNNRDITVSRMSCVSPFSNHLGGTGHCGRGGSLWIRFPDGQLVDLLAAADWSAVSGAKPAAGTIAVRHPTVAWAADRAIFSMVVGAPASADDATTFAWQLYEITLPTKAALALGDKPVVTRVAHQPSADNIDPAYAPDGRIVFVSARPYNGAPHLTQREEYLGLPTVSGLWILDPASGDLQLLHHAPSGAFAPSIDSFGRVLFESWDHLSRDPEAVTDSRPPATGAPYNETFVQTHNGAGNFADEGEAAAFTDVTAMAPETWDVFPEPRNFDKKTLIDVFGGVVAGQTMNTFLPWTIGLDGRQGEILNHVGRHEVAPAVGRSFTNDSNLVDLTATTNPGYGGMTARTFFNNFLAPREDPRHPGSYFGVDGADLGTHGAGQIVRLDHAGVTATGPENPDGIAIVYVTGGANGKAKPGFVPTVRASIDLAPSGLSPLTASNAETLYRTPLPCADGALVASEVSGVTQTDYNVGTHAQPASLYGFRLRSLKASGATWVGDTYLTSGLQVSTSYLVDGALVTYDGPAWELDPVEVVARTPPVAAVAPAIDDVEAQVFASAGVDVATFQRYLRDHDAALSVSRDVTLRDLHDRQQPFNLRVSWSGRQAVGAAGKVYDVAWLQVLEAELRRGYRLGGATPAPGRRVVATPMHTTAGENVAAAGAPTGAVKLGDDGSFAAVVPAGKALTWQLLADDQAKTSQVKERFWVTFQAGEIRTCPNCHGINTKDQTGFAGRPQNPPQALAELLVDWKARYPAGAMGFTAAAVRAAWTDGSVRLTVARTGGETGPVSIAYATHDGTARDGVDYEATAGRVAWADGEVGDKTIEVPLLGTWFTGADRTFTVVLTSPQYGAAGAVVVAVVTVAGAGVDPVVEPDADAGAGEDASTSTSTGEDASTSTSEDASTSASEDASTSTSGDASTGRSEDASTSTSTGTGGDASTSTSTSTSGDASTGTGGDASASTDASAEDTAVGPADTGDDGCAGAGADGLLPLALSGLALATAQCWRRRSMRRSGTSHRIATKA